MAIGMAITSAGSGNYLRTAKSSFQTNEPFSLSTNPNPNPPNNSVVRANSFSANHNSTRFIQRISAVNSADLPPKNNNSNPIISSSSSCDEDDKKQQPPTSTKWAVDSWKTKKAYDQLPEYPDMEELESVLETLDAFPPLVSAGEARDLEKLLGEAAMGNAFVLQGGDCSESFDDFKADSISYPFRLLLRMASDIMSGGQMPVIKVGRMAGQFAKHNITDPFEKRKGVELPSHRGDMVNGDAFDLKARTPDPQRLIRAYSQSAATLNVLRAFAHKAILDFTEENQQQQGDRYRELSNRVDKGFEFMSAARVTMDHHPIMSTIDFWTSHECLHLPYEQSLTRMDSTSGLYYDCSGPYALGWGTNPPTRWCSCRVP